MALAKERIPEIHFYEWSVSRWRASITRAQLDPTGRSIYRELLDICYTQGSIPKDHALQAAMAGCSVADIERVWPLLKRHFVAHKKDPELLTNKVADTYRRAYFSYIRKQKANRNGKPSKKVARKSTQVNEIHDGGQEIPRPIREEKRRDKKKREDTQTRGEHTDGLVEWIEAQGYQKPIGNSDGGALVSVLNTPEDVATFKGLLPAWIAYWAGVGWSYSLHTFLFDGHWKKPPPKAPPRQESIVDKRLRALRESS